MKTSLQYSTTDVTSLVIFGWLLCLNLNQVLADFGPINCHGVSGKTAIGDKKAYTRYSHQSFSLWCPLSNHVYCLPFESMVVMRGHSVTPCICMCICNLYLYVYLSFVFVFVFLFVRKMLHSNLAHCHWSSICV